MVAKGLKFWGGLESGGFLSISLFAVYSYLLSLNCPIMYGVYQTLSNPPPLTFEAILVHHDRSLVPEFVRR